VSVVRRDGIALALVVGVGAILTGLASFAHAPVAVRAPLVLAFALIGPGAALVPLLGLRDPLGELTLAIGLSLSLDVGVGLAMVYASAWAPAAGLAILIWLTLAGAAAQLALALRGKA
jgi:hypothetical protein